MPFTREIVQRIVDARVAPLVRADGGEITLVDVTDDGLVRVRLDKACAGCPGAQFTVEGLLARELRAAAGEAFAGVEVLLPANV